MSKIWRLGAADIRKALARRELSPIELLDSLIDRISALDPIINAIPIRCFDLARQSAVRSEQKIKSGESLGRLEGIPIVIKDLNNVKGVRTTFGSPLYANFVPDEDDDVVASIRAAGAVIIGKSNVPEHGFGATTANPLFGSTNNPFAPSLSAGASTGGGAAAVAANMVPLATGSDFAGSLRTPASFCSIFGLRPSNGVVGTTRRALGWSPFDVEGPMARSAADLKLLLSVMAKDEPGDPLSRPVSPELTRPVRNVDLGGLRVAVSEDLGFAPMSVEYRAAFQSKIQIFSSIFKVCQTAHPYLGDADRTFFVLRALGFVADFAPMRAQFGEALGPVVLDELRRAETLSLSDYANAEKEHTSLVRRTHTFFRDFDLLITPAASVPPFPHADEYPSMIDGEVMGGYLRWEAIAYGITLTGCPALVMPAGLGPANMPFGLQIVAARGRDAFLIDVAHTLETRFATDPLLARLSPDGSR